MLNTLYSKLEKTANRCHDSKTVKPKNGGVTNKAIALETLVRKIQWLDRCMVPLTKILK